MNDTMTYTSCFHPDIALQILDDTAAILRYTLYACAMKLNILSVSTHMVVGIRLGLDVIYMFSTMHIQP